MNRITTRLSFASSERQALMTAITRYLRKSICLLLVLSLLVTSTPAAPQTIVTVAKERSTDFAFWFQGSVLRKLAIELVQGRGSNGKGQEKQRDRDAKVARIQIFPGDATVELNEQIAFAA